MKLKHLVQAPRHLRQGMWLRPMSLLEPVVMSAPHSKRGCSETHVSGSS
jgi:hypothetical protein